jgi:hypothetical protein
MCDPVRSSFAMICRKNCVSRSSTFLRLSVSTGFLWERLVEIFNPYGIEDWPQPGAPVTVSKEEDDPDFIAAKRVLLTCAWFHLYDLIEKIYRHMEFHDEELSGPDEELQASPFQQKLNEYFEYAGIGWKSAQPPKSLLMQLCPHPRA